MLYNWIYISDIIQSSDGNFYGVGTSSSDNIHENILIVKFDTELNLLDNKSFNLGVGDIARLYGAQLASGNLMMYGSLFIQDGMDQFFLAISSNLDSIYSQIIVEPGIGEEAYGIIANDDSTFEVLGKWPGVSTAFASILKYNSNYEVVDTIIQNIVGGASSFFKKQNGNYLVGGENEMNLTNYYVETGIVEITDDGIVNDSFFFGKPDTIFLPAWSKNLDSYYSNELFFGGTFHIQYGDLDGVDNWILINKVDSSLNLVWQKFIGGDSFHSLHALKATKDHGIAFSGFTGALDSLYTIIGKLDAEGNLLTTLDFIENPTSFKLYPNPGKDVLFVDVESKESITLNITELNGRIVLSKALINNKNEINVHDLPNGLYLIDLYNPNGKIVTSKWIKTE